jgi:hypothetical protein
MLKVLPIQSKDEQERICNAANVKYDPDLLAYAATVDDVLVGVSQFKLTSKGGIVYDIAPIPDRFDFEALFVLGRGTLNFIDLTGVHKAFYDAPVDESNEMLVRRIGFCKRDDGRFFVDLTNFFTSPCQHDKH